LIKTIDSHISLRAIAVAVVVLVLLISFMISLLDITRYGGADLRNKVVGARALWLGLDPYSYDFTAGMSERLLDPLACPVGTTRVTVPPPVLYVYAVFSGLSYKSQRFLWFFLEWASLIIATWLLAKLSRHGQDRLPFLLIATFFFLGGFFWRLHLERGQYYVFVLLLMSVAAFYSLHEPKKPLLAGIALGVVAAMRPSYVVMIAPLLIFKRFGMAVSMLASGLALVLLTTAVSGPDLWRSYFRAVQAHEQYMVHSDSPPNYITLGFPSTVEGADFSQMLTTHTWNETILGTYLFLKKRLPGRVPDFSIKWVLRITAAIFVICYLLLLYSVRNRFESTSFPLLASYVLALDLDYFLPIRWGYMDILLLSPLALIMFSQTRGATHSIFLTIIIVALACTHYDFHVLSTAIRNLAVMGTINMFMLWSVFIRPREILKTT
jgi:hypothetical protein